MTSTPTIGRLGFGRGTSSRGRRRGGIFSEFDAMRRATERIVEEAVYYIERLPPNLIRQYQMPEGETVQEVGPIVCGCAATFGPDDLPQIREFGNVRSSATFAGSMGASTGSGGGMSMLKAEREPQIGIVTTDKEIRIVVEIPGGR
jgi:HSP20 family protein